MSTQPGSARLQAQAPGQVGGRAHRPARTPGRFARRAARRARRAEHRLGGDVEGAVRVADDRPPVGLADVVGVDGLEAQAAAASGTTPGSGRGRSSELGQQRPDEEAADLGRRLALEDQRRAAAARRAASGARPRSGRAAARPRPCGGSRTRSAMPSVGQLSSTRGPSARASRRRPRRRGRAPAPRPRRPPRRRAGCRRR